MSRLISSQKNLLILPDELIQEIALSLTGNDLFQFLQVPEVFTSLSEIIRVQLPRNTNHFTPLPHISRHSCKEIHWRKKLPHKSIYCIEVNSVKELKSDYFRKRFPTITPATALIYLNFKWDKDDKSQLGDKRNDRSLQIQFNRHQLATLTRCLPMNATVYLGNQESDNMLNFDMEDSSFFQKNLEKDIWKKDLYLMANLKDLRISLKDGETRFFERLLQYVESIYYCEAKLEIRYLNEVSLGSKVHSLDLEDLTKYHVDEERNEKKKMRFDDNSTLVPPYNSISTEFPDFLSFDGNLFINLKSLSVSTKSTTISNLLLPQCISLRIDFQPVENGNIPTFLNSQAPNLVIAEISYNNTLIDFNNLRFPRLKTLLLKGMIPSRKNNVKILTRPLWNFPSLEVLQLSNISQLEALSKEKKISLIQLQVPIFDYEDCMKVKEIVSYFKGLTHIVTHCKDPRLSIHVMPLNALKLKHTETTNNQEEMGLFPDDIETNSTYKEFIKHSIMTELNKYDNSYRRKSRMEILDEKRNFFEKYRIKQMKFQEIF